MRDKIDKISVKTVNLPIDEIVLGKYTARFFVDTKYIETLAESIKIEGQLKPIVVRRNPEEEKWELIDGEHRWRAMKALGETSVRAEVRPLEEDEARALAVVINMMHGKPLDKFEVAQAIKRFHDKGKSETQIANIFGRSQQWVSFQLSVATRVAEPVQQALTTRVVSPAHVREIAELPEDQQTKVAAAVVREGLSFRDTEQLVHAIKEDPLVADRLTGLRKDELEHEFKGMIPIKTREEFEVLGDVAEASSMTETETGACPKCGARYRVDWGEGRLEWQ